jgi:cytochrome d ubiquinol oxidase subunit II
VVAGTVAFGGLFVLRADAPYLFEGLHTRALPVVLLSVACGVGTLVLLVRAVHQGARVLAAGAVLSIILAWGVAQWDYVLPETLTVAAAAAPNGTLATLLVATAMAVVLVVPAFVLLYILDQRGLLPEESV